MNNLCTKIAVLFGVALQLLAAGCSADQPNIIYILADDAGIADFGTYGGEIISTPNVDRLAAGGMKFTNHYAGATLCAPSRSALMTGLHSGHSRIRGNRLVALQPEDVTMAEVLKRAGYTTGIIGKWGLGDSGSDGTPEKQGFDYFFGFLSQTRAHRYYPEYLWQNTQKILYPENPTLRTDYSHDHFTAKALEFIRRNKSGPFFLYLPFTIPHVDLDVPEDSMRPYYAKFGAEKPSLGRGKYRDHPTPHAAWAGMISRMDRDIGRIVDLVRELGIEENTMIVFSSDNGVTVAGGADPDFFDSNGPYRGAKRDLYEGGIIAPMIAYWPGVIEAGSVTDHVSAFWDDLSTFAELAGVSAPTGTDGISFAPTLMGKPSEQKEHPYLYWEFPDNGGKVAVRMGDWKAVRLNVSIDQNAPIELYNLKEDIGETRDVALQHSEVVKAMALIMQEAHTRSDSFPLYASEFDPK